LKGILKAQFNPYFFIPFMLWCIAGAYLLCSYDSTYLFSGINQHYHPVTDLLMEVMSRLGEGGTIVLIGLCFWILKPFRNLYFFTAAVLCTLVPSLVTQLVKYQVAAPRPMTVYADQAWVHHLNHWALLHNNSFPSGHTTGAFSFFCMLACIMPGGKRAWGLFFFLFALLTGYARVYLAAHFFADVYVGSIIGTILSFSICAVVFYIKSRNEHASLVS
jgi:membrane-associated phospholipid phosphatase